MRKIMIAATGVALAFGPAVYAQAQTAPPPVGEDAPAQSRSATIRSVTVVDLDELPTETRSQVSAQTAKNSDADLQRLRAAVDSIPQAASALEARGMTSSQVVAANVDRNGTLLLVTKKST